MSIHSSSLVRVAAGVSGRRPEWRAGRYACRHVRWPFLVLALVTLAALSRAAPAPAFRDFFRPYLEQHAVAGVVVLVADQHAVLAHEAYGFADLAAQRPMATNSLFWIASQSKPLTATALMMLVDE